MQTRLHVLFSICHSYIHCLSILNGLLMASHFLMAALWSQMTHAGRAGAMACSAPKPSAAATASCTNATALLLPGLSSLRHTMIRDAVLAASQWLYVMTETPSYPSCLLSSGPLQLNLFLRCASHTNPSRNTSSSLCGCMYALLIA